MPLGVAKHGLTGREAEAVFGVAQANAISLGMVGGLGWFGMATPS